MRIRFSCPSCGKHLRAPEDWASREVHCPQCNQPVQVPLPHAGAAPAEDPAAVGDAPVPSSRGDVPDMAEWPLPSRLGAVSAALGLAAVLALCLPFVGYVSVGLSGAGLVLGLYGLFRALGDDAPGSGGPFAVGGGAARGFGTRAVDFPLVGVGACLAALALALAPVLG
jgi:hypothetical protein